MLVKDIITFLTKFLQKRENRDQRLKEIINLEGKKKYYLIIIVITINIFPNHFYFMFPELYLIKKDRKAVNIHPLKLVVAA